MKKLYRNITLMMAVFAIAFVQAQEVSPVDFMRMNPYQMKTNPAADLPYESVMSLLVGNIGLDVQNTTLRYDYLFDFDADGRPASINLRQLANSLKEKNFVGVNSNVDFFTLYRRLKKGMLTINYGVKEHSDVKFNDGLFKLLGYGNVAFTGESNPVKVNMDVNAQLYQELAVGYQLNVSEKLSLGGRAKLLFGIGNVTTDVMDARLFTDPDSYALRLEEEVAVRMSMPKVMYVDDRGRLIANGMFSMGDMFCNLGFGVDLAAEYHFDDQFSMVAAVTDLGFIHWGYNNIELDGHIHNAGQFYDNGGFLFNGMDMDQLQLVISDESYRELFLDTLQHYFQLEFAYMEKYNTALNTNVLLRGNYDLDAHNRFSAQVQGRFLGSGFRPAFTLAYNGNFFEKLDVCATYTIMPNSYDNIGLGIAGVFDTFHIYLTTNNIIGCFKPLNASTFNAQVGIVFNLWLPERRAVGHSEG